MPTPCPGIIERMDICRTHVPGQCNCKGVGIIPRVTGHEYIRPFLPDQVLHPGGCRFWDNDGDLHTELMASKGSRIACIASRCAHQSGGASATTCLAGCSNSPDFE